MAKTKKKFYAVASGLKPGIYDKWFGPGGAEEQIRGVAKARYKGFFTRQEAQEWLKAGGNPMAGKSTSAKSTTRRETPLPPDHPDNAGRLIIYTDGGCHKNPGPGGYGAVLMHEDKKKELSNGFRLTTNNRMELTAVIEALKALKKPCSVLIYSDSRYVVNGIEKGWARNWKRKGWMRTPDQPAINPDLWAQLLDLTDKHDVKFNWVKGHAGIEGNERCDQLANEAIADKNNLAIDEEYEKNNC